MKQRSRNFTFFATALLVIGALFSSCTGGQRAQAGNGHPDLTGIWNGGAARGLAASAENPLATYVAARDGTLLNCERDGALVRRADPNKPLYKPQFWDKVQKLDQNGNKEDPSYGCMPAGVPRMGPPSKIVQT